MVENKLQVRAFFMGKHLWMISCINQSENQENRSQDNAGNNCRNETTMPIILIIHSTTTTGHIPPVLYANPDLNESNCTIYIHTFYGIG